MLKLISPHFTNCTLQKDFANNDRFVFASNPGCDKSGGDRPCGIDKFGAMKEYLRRFDPLKQCNSSSLTYG